MMKHLKNNRGVLTLDFLFAFIMTLGLTTVLFVLSFGLSLFEIVQYLAFSSSRSMYAGQITIEQQQKAGTQKFEELLAAPALKPLFKSDWVDLKLSLVGASTNPTADNSIQKRYTDDPVIMKALVGTVVNIHAKFLDFQLPFLGSTTGEEGGGFKTRVTSFVGREPTQLECMDVINQRWKKITEITGTSGFVNGDDASYIPLDDNGC